MTLRFSPSGQTSIGYKRNRPPNGLEPHLSSNSEEELARNWTQNLPYIAAYVGALSENFHDSQDILQEVAVAVVRKYSAYNRERPFLPWATGIARNEVLAYRRRKAINRQYFDDKSFNLISDAFARAEDEASPLLDALQECMKHSSGKTQRLLRLRYVSDLRYDQMAEKLGMSASSIMVAMHRLRSALHDCITRRLNTGRMP
jgi:RNA polymerase sigma-70 factor (ECF subfamily)